MEQFASENSDKFKVVGIGTQDNLNLAKDFYNRRGPQSATMAWDSTGQAWRELGVFSQPSWILVDANGETLIRLQLGRINENEVLSAVAS